MEFVPSQSQLKPAMEQERAYSLGSAALHGLAGELAKRVADASEVDTSAALVPLLACAGAALDRGVYYQHGQVRHRPTLYAAAITGTPLVPYASCLTAIRWVVRSAERGCGAEVVRDAHIGTLLSSDRTIVAAGPTGTAESIPLIAFGDLGTTFAFLARPTNKLAGILRHFWDEIGGLAVVGHLAEMNLLNTLKPQAMLDAASYFLWFSVPPPRPAPFPLQLDDSECERFARSLGGCIKVAQSLRRIAFNTPAQELWTSEYARLLSQRSDAAGLVTSRGSAQVIRLSTIFALLDSSSEIAEPHLRAGLAVWDYCRKSAQTMFGTHTDGHLANRLLDALDEPHTLSQLHGILHNHTSAALLRAALGHLEAAALVERKTISSRGRPAEVWCKSAKPA